MSAVKEIYDAKLDPDFQDPYIDVDERRERVLSDGTKVPYRYIHGEFEKKGVKFIFCFPEKKGFKGRFFQYLSPSPGPDEELASLDNSGEDDKIAFFLLNGAYYVESNMGSQLQYGFGGAADLTLCWKASAAVAEYSRVKAMEIYGCGRPYGYVYGGSGGGYKSMACIENTNAWDGAAPYVIGSPVSLPNTLALHAQGQRCLRRVFGQIVDAVDAGGSGDIYAGLTEDEAALLKEITAMGFPPGAWFPEANGMIDDGALPVVLPGVKVMDPRYFKDFWEIPGYLGADPTSNAVRDRLKFRGIVKSVHVPETVIKTEDIDGRNGVDDAWQKMLTDGKDAWIELEEVPMGDDLYLSGVDISIETGDAAGRQLRLGSIRDHYLVIGMCYGMEDLSGVMAMIKPGDKVLLDNSDYIAIQSYYRHQVPEDLSFHAWDQFRDENGKPVLPQRSEVIGYGYTGTGTVQDGCLQGKVIIVQALMDESTCPWCGDWYRNKVIRTMGNEKDFRLYYMERCRHWDGAMMENNMVTNYMGALYQALLDLSDWVERGVMPPATTGYKLKESQIHLAGSVSVRKGIQPVVTMSANGSSCARVKAGEPVYFEVRAEVPEGAGMVTAVDYDFVENKMFPNPDVFRTKGSFEATVEGNIHGAVSTVTHTYDMPGIYFASVRVKSNRKGDASNLFTQVRNIARARVIVE